MKIPPMPIGKEGIHTHFELNGHHLDFTAGIRKSLHLR